MKLSQIPEMIEMKKNMYILASSCPNLDEIISRVWSWAKKGHLFLSTPVFGKEFCLFENEE